MSRDFAAALKEANTKFETMSLSREADLAIRETLERGSRKESRRPLVFAVAFAAVAFAAIVLFLRFRTTEQMLGAWIVASASADMKASFAADGTLSIDEGSCTLLTSSREQTILARKGSNLRDEAGLVRVVGGVVEMKVSHRPDGSSPARVLVSHGAIEIMGTRFTIRQDEDRGHVDLHEGKIRFVPTPKGESVVLAPGDSLDWPPPKAPTESSLDVTDLPSVRGAGTATADPSTPKKTPEAPAESIEALIERVHGLRSRGEFAEAARILESALGSELSPRKKELLSFELGTLLSDSLRDRPRACAHWQKHEQAFPDGMYKTEVKQAEKRAFCGDSQ